MAVVFLGRFTPGLRLPTYVATGLLPTRAASFALYFLVACLIWTPAIVGATVLFGDGLLQSLFRERGGGAVAFTAALLAGFTLLSLLRRVVTHRGQREVLGFLRRKLRWEFWPPYLSYLPLIPYLVYLALRHRSFMVFTAANPGMPAGGFVGNQSRTFSVISALEAPPLRPSPSSPHRFRHTPGPSPRTLLGRAGWSASRRLKAGRRRTRRGCCYSAFLRQDGGLSLQSGIGCHHSALHRRPRVRRLLRPPPPRTEGGIFSITWKRLPRVTGDGRSSSMNSSWR